MSRIPQPPFSKAPPTDKVKSGRAPAMRAAALSLVPLGFAGGFVGARYFRRQPNQPLPPPLDAQLEHLHIPFGDVAFYRAGSDTGVPLLLVHSINAAANAYEVKPLFEHFAQSRPVYALDLPGFGLSDRLDRIYTPQLMAEAILAAIERIRELHGHYPIDAIALSLSCEFLARVGRDHPLLLRSLGLISPTGFEAKLEREGAAGTTYGRPSVRDVVSFPLWGRALFDGLVSRPSMRFFLRKTWGAANIDEGLLDYDYLAAHQPGAEHAPFSFVAGFLFSRDALSVYKELTLPVWMCHGVRGDFVDYGRKRDVSGRPNWSIDVLQTGAFPQFERPEDVTSAYSGFLARLG